MILSLNIAKAIDSGDKISRVLTQAIEDHLEGLLSDPVGIKGYFDRPLGGRKRLVTRQETEAVTLLTQQATGKLPMAQTNLALLGNRAWNTKGLQPLT